MHLPDAVARCGHVAVLATLTIVIVFVVGAGPASAGPAQTPDGLAEINASAPPAASLPPIVKTVLAEALAREKIEKHPRPAWSTAWRVSFPLPVCLFEHGLCGAVNRDGSIAVAPRFDFVDDFHERRAVVRLGGLYGYVDTDGKVVVEPQYAIAGRYRLGFAEVDIGGKSALIDLEGRQVLEPRFASAIPFTMKVFWVHDGVRDYSGPPGSEELPGPDFRFRATQLKVKGKWGLVDASGAWIRKPEFRDVAVFDPENNNLMWAQADTGWGLIRPDGTWQIEPTFESKRELSDGLAAVSQGGRRGYINRTGEIAIPLKFDATYFSTDFVDGMPGPAKLGMLVGLINRSGDWVVEPAYDSIDPRWRDGTSGFKGFVVKRGQKYGVLDQSGKIIIDLQIDQGVQPPARSTGRGIIISFGAYDSPKFCADGRIIGLVEQKPRFFTPDGKLMELPQGELSWPTCDAPHMIKVGDRFGYVDQNLRTIIEAKFESAGQFHNGLTAVKLNGRYGLIRADGSWALEPEFDSSGPLQDNIAMVKVGRRAGLVDVTTGALVTQDRFNDVCSLGRGVVGVMLHGKMGAIDQKGHWLIEPNYEPWRFTFTYQGFVPAQAQGRWGFLDWAGNAIDARYDDVRPFERGVAWAKSGAEWCPVDRRGNKVPALQCQSADPNPAQRPKPERVTRCEIWPQ